MGMGLDLQLPHSYSLLSRVLSLVITNQTAKPKGKKEKQQELVSEISQKSSVFTK